MPNILADLKLKKSQTGKLTSLLQLLEFKTLYLTYIVACNGSIISLFLSIVLHTFIAFFNFFFFPKYLRNKPACKFPLAAAFYIEVTDHGKY